MARYLIESERTAQGRASLMTEGYGANEQYVRSVISGLGGKVLRAMTFNGDYDQIFVVELADAETCAAAYITLSGAEVQIRTTRVFTSEEMDAACARVPHRGRAPGSRHP